MLTPFAGPRRSLGRGFVLALLSTAAIGLVVFTATAETKQAKTKPYKIPPTVATGAKGVAKGVGGGVLVIAQTTDGALEQTDEVFADDATFFDLWSFEGKQGDLAIVRMIATDFVPCVGLFLSGTLPMAIGGVCEDATLIVPLPKTGTYLVAANAANPGDVGGYRIRVDVLPGL
jgi:hypothetical protein